jgi:hypothetical protein
METVKSNIAYSYKTIKLTQSRLNKGLLAIPVSLIELFPSNKNKVQILFDKTNNPIEKRFTPYSSSSRECRIGGMRDFFGKNKLKNGDELVIQALDKDLFRIMTEKQFQNYVKNIEQEIESVNDEFIINIKLKELSQITNSTLLEVSLSEFKRLSENKMEKRAFKKPRSSRPKESAPRHLRILLTKLYHGKCQITGFGFTTKKGFPYYEIHHIKPNYGNHIKNLLVVSPNVHAQFTYALVEEYFDNNGWLRRVKLNEQEFSVFQIINNIPQQFSKEIHS